MADQGKGPRRPTPDFNRAADPNPPPPKAKTVSNTHHVPKPPSNEPRGPGGTPRGAVRVSAPPQPPPQKTEPKKMASLKQEFRAAAEKKAQDKSRTDGRNR